MSRDAAAARGTLITIEARGEQIAGASTKASSANQSWEMMRLGTFGRVPPIKQPHEAGLFEAFEKGFTVTIAHLFDLIVRPELHCSILVNGGPDVLAISGRLDTFKLAYARHISQSGLDFRLTWHIERWTERVPS